MIRALLIATLVLLQLPQAIAGSVAVCFCADGMVSADQKLGCDHCRGSCHAHYDEATDEHSSTGCESEKHSRCGDCLHVSLFAGDNLKASIQPPTIDVAAWEVISISLFAPSPTANLSLEFDEPSFWLSEAGVSVALRC